MKRGGRYGVREIRRGEKNIRRFCNYMTFVGVGFRKERVKW